MAETGRSTGGKPISLHQLQGEMTASGMQVTALGMAGTTIFTYDANNAAADFADTAGADAAIAAHVAMRDKTDAEYSAEFQASETTAARKQQIRDQMNGLEPREQVQVTQDEWDARFATVAP